MTTTIIRVILDRFVEGRHEESNDFLLPWPWPALPAAGDKITNAPGGAGVWHVRRLELDFATGRLTLEVDDFAARGAKPRALVAVDAEVVTAPPAPSCTMRCPVCATRSEVPIEVDAKTVAVIAHCPSCGATLRINRPDVLEPAIDVLEAP